MITSIKWGSFYVLIMQRRKTLNTMIWRVCFWIQVVLPCTMSQLKLIESMVLFGLDS
uniref:Uncharacterized protein n=1 Tax=Arundo donax TaxID=35708 RepID=A0A0A9AXR8_ARUDO